MLALSVKIHEKSENENLSHLKWITELPRRHWSLNKHCTDPLLPKTLPNQELLTDESKYYWHLYLCKGKYSKPFNKNLTHSINSTLTRALFNNNLSLKCVYLSKNLINLDNFEDILSRQTFIRNAADFIRSQSSLEVVCLENLKLTKIEGYKLLLATASSSKSIKFLFLWKMFKRNEYTQKCKNKFLTKHTSVTNYEFSFHNHWLKAVASLRNIETLAINYAYIASSTGDLLIYIAKQLRSNLRYLQILCLPEEIPDTLNIKKEKNAVTIPDLAWNVARKLAPKLRVQMVILGIPEYDLHKKFLTQSIPMHTIVLSTNRELIFHKPCMVDCTLKTIYLFYHRHLVRLYLNLWNHREMIDHHLRKIFPCLPNLEVFEYLGEMKDPVTICTMCCQIKIGACAVKKVDMLLQIRADKKNNSADRMLQIKRFLVCYERIFETMGVKFNVRTYPA